MRNSAKKTRRGAAPKAWNFYLANGEWFAMLSFTTQQVKFLFKGARIEGDSVYLPTPV